MEGFLHEVFPAMANEAYEAYDRDISRRLEHAETRIKYWVVAGICANLLALVGLGIPLVYYVGSMNAQTSQSLGAVAIFTNQLPTINERLSRIEFEAAARETWMTQRGYVPPRRGER